MPYWYFLDCLYLIESKKFQYGTFWSKYRSHGTHTALLLLVPGTLRRFKSRPPFSPIFFACIDCLWSPCTPTPQICPGDDLKVHYAYPAYFPLESVALEYLTCTLRQYGRAVKTLAITVGKFDQWTVMGFEPQFIWYLSRQEYLIVTTQICVFLPQVGCGTKAGGELEEDGEKLKVNVSHE